MRDVLLVGEGHDGDALTVRADRRPVGHALEVGHHHRPRLLGGHVKVQQFLVVLAGGGVEALRVGRPGDAHLRMHFTGNLLGKRVTPVNATMRRNPT
jgi:hypothetical protein